MRVDLIIRFAIGRVRQAIALTLDRPAIARTLFSKFADLGQRQSVRSRFHLDGQVSAPAAQDIRKAKS